MHDVAHFCTSGERACAGRLGFFMLYQAWRRNVTGVQQGPLPFFWGVSKTV
jgi:hypothetical protein